MSLVTEIESIILKNIPDAMVIVHNINDDGEHFEAIVISEKFDTISLLKQHQMVMKPLREAFDTKVHALGLKTFSIKKWNESKEDFAMINKKIKEKYNQ
jgi:acid stress-induced BolA-like protein IbaG/YrbA